MRRDWTYLAAIAVLTLIACVRIGSTYRVFSPTVDEPAHLAAGMEYLTGRYTIDVSHPPLARALAALPLRLAGYPMPKRDPSEYAMGVELLQHSDRFEKTLARARMPILLFFIITIAATAAWARRAFPKSVAILAVAILTNLPPMLAHAGLITTDMAGAASMAVATLALDVYLTAPTRKRAVLVGLALAFGVLTKASFFVFFPACAVVLIAMRWRPRLIWRDVAIAIGVAFVTIWAGYKFDVARPVDVTQYAGWVFDTVSPPALKPLARWTALHAVMPAPALPTGIAILKKHDLDGHEAFLLGHVRTHGWWYYFPVVFFYKTPIPFLLLVAWGLRQRASWPFALVALAILLVAMTGSINIGVRHVLAMYAPLSVVAAAAVTEIWKRRDAFARTTLVALLAWLFVGVGVEHPDYLAWFNEAARPNPAAIAVDSNLDWGQDHFRLQRYIGEHGLRDVHVYTLGTLAIDGALPVDPHNVTHGWVAISETALALERAKNGSFSWLNVYRPRRRIGKSIRLYWIP